MHHRHGRMLKELVAWSEKNNAKLLKGGSIRNWIPEPAGGGSKGTSRMNSSKKLKKEWNAP